MTTHGIVPLFPEVLLNAGLLILIRTSAFLVFAPVFSSPAFPARAKVVFAFAVAVLLGPVAAGLPGAHPELSGVGILSEIAVGFGFGLVLSLLTEAVLFAAALMGVSFSFSLANLLDPNSLVETEVLGSALNWFAMLVLLCAGLHRSMLAAFLRTLILVPVGTATLSNLAGGHVLQLASGIFAAGLQLASPVIASALLVEVVAGLVSRMTPALPAQVCSIPVKAMVSYVVLIGSLGLWPVWIEHRFTALLETALHMVAA